MLNKDFFNPKSIAVIGASTHPEKIGFSVLKNIVDGGFGGKIFPINPDAEDILGIKCHPNVLQVSAAIDLAVLVVPAPVVPQVLIDCGKKRIKYAIIISAGFAESGLEGKERQQQIEKIAELYNIRVLGPNCLGLIDPVNRLNISFANNLPKEKDIAVVSQSGATCTAILDWANETGIGFSHFISLGNKMDLNENDFIKFFTLDPTTRVVLGYLESISEGSELLEYASELSKKKPFIVLKAGKSEAGKKAAVSHTGALAGDDLVVSTAFHEAGVIRAETLEDLFEWGMSFSNIRESKDGQTLVITNAGGPGVMTADSIAASGGLKFFEFNSAQKRRLEKILPLGATVANPLDLLGDATSERFEKVFEVLSENKPDYTIILLTPQVNTDAEKIAEVIARNKNERTVVVLLGGSRFGEAKKILAKAHVPVFLYPERAVRALSVLTSYGEYKSKPKTNEHYVKGFKKAAERIISSKYEFNDTDIAKILAAYNIPMASSYLTRDVDEAIVAAKEIGYPVVLKVTSPDILHKTEAGAIKLGIENEESLKNSYEEVIQNAKKHYPEANILGVTVYKMVRSTIEVALGAKRDPVFGPVIMFGLGGIYIELLSDFSLGLAPISLEKAEKMIHGIKSFKMLDGFRNGEHFDIKAIATAISGLSELLIDFPGIKEVDINPVRVQKKGEGILALDAKIILEKSEILVS